MVYSACGIFHGTKTGTENAAANGGTDMETIIKGDQLEKIKHFLQKGYYDSAVKTA